MQKCLKLPRSQRRTPRQNRKPSASPFPKRQSSLEFINGPSAAPLQTARSATSSCAEDTKFISVLFSLGRNAQRPFATKETHAGSGNGWNNGKSGTRNFLHENRDNSPILSRRPSLSPLHHSEDPLSPHSRWLRPAGCCSHSMPPPYSSQQVASENQHPPPPAA